MIRAFAILAVLTAGSFAFAAPAPTPWVLSAPAQDRVAHIDRNGTTVLPNGRLLTPRGVQVIVAPHPYGLALSPDGRTAVTANSGMRPFSLSIITDLNAVRPSVRQIPPGASNGSKLLPATFMGVAIAPDNRTLYASGGDDGVVHVFDLQGSQHRVLSLNTKFRGTRFADSFAGALTLSPDGGFLYVVDQANFRLVVLDTVSGGIVDSVPVGRYPFAVTLSPDGRTAYVANIGLFQYSPIDPRPVRDVQHEGVSFPPFGYPSEAATDGAKVEGKRVPGLGDPNGLVSHSVWAIDVSQAGHATVRFRTPCGVAVGDEADGVPAVGGSAPDAVAATADRVFVSNANDDSVTMLNAKTGKRLRDIELTPIPYLRGLRGVIPFGLALSPDSRRLYVAEAGINAVAVVDARSGKVRGHIPTGWFPSQVAVSPDGKRLLVANAKGFGAGPNGGADFHPGPDGSYIGNLMHGTVSILPVPDDDDLDDLTDRVIANNVQARPEAPDDRDGPMPVAEGLASDSIKYVVFITKENRTFDQVFGDYHATAAQTVNGDPTLAGFGAGRTIGVGSAQISDVDVMPNHRALADDYGLSDNFYVDSDVSADGHRWLVDSYPGPFLETGTPASYGDHRSFRLRTSAPGRLAFSEENGSVTPEDYLEAGSLWEHLDRHGITFANFGEGMEGPGVSEGAGLKPTGLRVPINMPMPEALFEHTDRKYPCFNLNIPDQYRADRFIEQLQSRWVSGKEPFPQFVNIYLPNDHGMGARPADGYPYVESYMADNDLALGRIVEALSRTPFWRRMVVFVTEDDAQSGRDHVDAHRSLLLAIGPWIKRGYVSHRHADMASIMKTIFHILGLPPLNQYDAAASDLSDFFTDRPYFGAYVALSEDLRLFDPTRARDPGDPSTVVRDDPRLSIQQQGGPRPRAIRPRRPAEAERPLHRHPLLASPLPAARGDGRVAGSARNRACVRWNDP